MINTKIKNRPIAWAAVATLSLVLSALLLVLFWAYKVESSSEAILLRKSNVSISDEVCLSFSSLTDKKSVEGNINISPELKYSSEWKSGKNYCLKLEEHLLPSQEYLIHLGETRTFLGTSRPSKNFVFSSVDHPVVNYVDPADGEADIGYEKEIVVKFNRKIESFYHLEVSVKPFPEGGVESNLDESGRVLTLRPKTALLPGTEYEVSVNINHRQLEGWGKKLYQGKFGTKPLPKTVYSLDKEGNPARIEDRKEPLVPAIKEGKYIDIDISSQTLYLVSDGLEQNAFKVSTGKRGMDTPLGTFKVMGKAKRPWSKKYSLYMPWFVQFTNQGHGLHELPEWPGGYKEGANHLGIPVSHGCVRLGVGPAKIVYDFAEKDTPIVIHD